MRKKHPTLGKRNLAKLYFLTDQKDKEKTVDDNSPLIDSVNKNSKFKNNKWTFHGKSWTKSRYNKTKTERFAYLLNPTNCTPITAAIRYLLPEKLRNVNAFDKEIKEVIDKRLKLTLEISPKTPTLKDPRAPQAAAGVGGAHLRRNYSKHKKVNAEYVID